MTTYRMNNCNWRDECRQFVCMRHLNNSLQALIRVSSFHGQPTWNLTLKPACDANSSVTETQQQVKNAQNADWKAGNPTQMHSTSNAMIQSLPSTEPIWVNKHGLPELANNYPLLLATLLFIYYKLSNDTILRAWDAWYKSFGYSIRSSLRFHNFVHHYSWIL